MEAEAHSEGRVRTGTQAASQAEEKSFIKTKLELICRCRDEPSHQALKSFPLQAEALFLTWWQACLYRWSTKSQISFGICSGISLASSLFRKPICSTDFSWWQRAHKVTGKLQSLQKGLGKESLEEGSSRTQDSPGPPPAAQRHQNPAPLPPTTPHNNLLAVTNQQMTVPRASSSQRTR